MSENKEYDIEYSKIRQSPYEYIIKWMDKSLLFVGRQAFVILALLPMSLFLPKIILATTHIRANSNNMIISNPGDGKCLKKGSLIILSDGTYKKIEDTTQEDMVLSLSESTLKIVPNKVLFNINNGIKKCYKLKTQAGREIDVTDNHPFYTILGWKELKNLKIGEYIACPRKLSFISQDSVSDSLSKILAYLIGDGHISKNVSFTNSNLDILSEFEESIRNISNNLKVTRYTKRGNRAIDCKVSSIRYVGKKNISYSAREKNDLMILLEKIGLAGTNSYTKFIPDCILKSDDSKVSLFLNRLFSCDGCIHERLGMIEVDYSSNSKRLIYQIRDMLLRQEIQSSIRFRKVKLKGRLFPTYELKLINLKDCVRFIEWVGLIKGKEKISLKILNKREQKQFYRDIIPIDFWKVHKDKRFAKKLKIHIDRSVSRGNLLRLNTELSKKHHNSDVYWDKIISIEESEVSETFDLVVENNHNFISNGIIVHNSTLAKKLALLSYNPIVRRTITEADLIATVFQLKWITLIIEDLTQTAHDGYSVIKAIEGIIGDEGEIGKSTLRNDFTGEVKGVGFLGITPQDLDEFSHELEVGLLSRCTVTLISLTHQERKKIREFINLYASDLNYQKECELMEKAVIEFYDELKMIQRNRHGEYLEKKFGKEHGKKIIQGVSGYDINIEFRRELTKKCNIIDDNLHKIGNSSINNRDSHEYYRFLCNLAFLNIHNRKNDNGILVPNEADHKIALNLAIENMKLKWAIPIALKRNKKIHSVQDLKEFLNMGMPDVIKDVLKVVSPFSRFLENE